MGSNCECPSTSPDQTKKTGQPHLVVIWALGHCDVIFTWQQVAKLPPAEMDKNECILLFDSCSTNAILTRMPFLDEWYYCRENFWHQTINQRRQASQIILIALFWSLQRHAWRGFPTVRIHPPGSPWCPCCCPCSCLPCWPSKLLVGVSCGNNIPLEDH